MAGPTRDFWQSKFESRHTPWDRGGPSPQLGVWLADEMGTAPMRIAVPGCGSGWEVADLAAAGHEVIALDYAEAAVQRTQALLNRRGQRARVETADVLQWLPSEPLDGVYEQTCLCALHPDHWSAYAARLHQWLRPGGRLFALFMQTLRAGAADGVIEGPPYHCDIHAMRALFPQPQWQWPKPPYPRVPHPMGIAELAVVLVRR